MLPNLIPTLGTQAIQPIPIPATHSVSPSLPTSHNQTITPLGNQTPSPTPGSQTLPPHLDMSCDDEETDPLMQDIANNTNGVLTTATKEPKAKKRKKVMAVQPLPQYVDLETEDESPNSQDTEEESSSSQEEVERMDWADEVEQLHGSWEWDPQPELLSSGQGNTVTIEDYSPPPSASHSAASSPLPTTTTTAPFPATDVRLRTTTANQTSYPHRRTTRTTTPRVTMPHHSRREDLPEVITLDDDNPTTTNETNTTNTSPINTQTHAINTQTNAINTHNNTSSTQTVLTPYRRDPERPYMSPRPNLLPTPNLELFTNNTQQTKSKETNPIPNSQPTQPSHLVPNQRLTQPSHPIPNPRPSHRYTQPRHPLPNPRPSHPLPNPRPTPPSHPIPNPQPSHHYAQLSHPRPNLRPTQPSHRYTQPFPLSAQRQGQLSTPSGTSPSRPPTHYQSGEADTRPPSAMFWWCWDDKCGRSNQLATKYCGYCGCARYKRNRS